MYHRSWVFFFLGKFCIAFWLLLRGGGRAEIKACILGVCAFWLLLRVEEGQMLDASRWSGIVFCWSCVVSESLVWVTGG